MHGKLLASSVLDSEEVPGEEMGQEVAGSAHTDGEKCS